MENFLGMRGADDTLEVKAALQRDLGKAEKWNDGNHTGSNKGGWYKVLPQDRQITAMRTGWEGALQIRPWWGHSPAHQRPRCSKDLPQSKAGYNVTHLPGRSRAESRRSGLLVAPMTNTSLLEWRPSSSARSCETTLQRVR